MRRALAVLSALAAALAGCAHESADGAGADWHPIDHFTSHASFRATFYTRAVPAGEAPWPTPGASVGVVQLTCVVRETAAGRRVRCEPGSALDPTFAATQHSERSPSQDLRDRLSRCYAVHPTVWPKDAVARYEAALAADPGALPPSPGEAYVIVTVEHDEAPFLGHCREEPDGTCLYSAVAGPDETAVAVHAARAGRPVVTLPFHPTQAVLRLSFEDGMVPWLLRGTGDGMEHEKPRDASGIAWEPIVSYYRKDEPTSRNFPLVLALAGRLKEARAMAPRAIDEAVDASAETTVDPCAKGKP